MSVEIKIGPEKELDLLTGSELQKGRIYKSTMGGSKGFLFIKLGDSYNNAIIAFSEQDGKDMNAASGHGRDFYLAPKGTEICIRN